MALEPQKQCIFNKSIVINNLQSQAEQATEAVSIGQIRYNKLTNRFEGYHDIQGADIFGNQWRTMVVDVATASNIGGIRVGSGLSINPTTGILTSIASGESRIYQRLITVSPFAGAADYTSINDAISNAIGTPAGNYTDGTLTNGSNGAPSFTNRFILLLSPGSYTETTPNTILLPDYTSIISDIPDEAIINLTTANNSPSNSALITLGHSSILRNLRLNIDPLTPTPDTTTTIYANSKSNIILDNLTIINSNSTTTSNVLPIYITNTDTIDILNSKIALDISRSTTQAHPITFTTSANININNLTTHLIAPTTLPTTSNIINLINNTYNNATISHSKLTTPLNAIFTANTSLNLDNSQIHSGSHLIGSNHSSARGSITATIPNPITINGITNTITLPTPPINSGFIISGRIHINGTTNNNDGIYTITNLDNTLNTINIDSAATLTTETTTTAVFTALHTITINQNTLTSTDKLINDVSSTPTPVATYVLNTNQIAVQTPTLANNILETEALHIITVGHHNADFYKISDAIASISQSSNSRRFLIQIQTGLYTETQQLTIPQFTSIQGIGKVILTSTHSANSLLNSPTILMSNNTTIDNIQINIAPSGTPTYASGLGLISLTTNVVISNISIRSSTNAVNLIGCVFNSSSDIILSNLDIQFSDTTNTNTTTKGIYLNNYSQTTTLAWSGIFIYIQKNTLASSSNYGIHSLDSFLEIHDLNLSISGTTTTVITKGIYCEQSGSSTTWHKTILHNGSILVDDTDTALDVNDYQIVVISGFQIRGQIYQLNYDNLTAAQLFTTSSYSITNNKYIPLNSVGEPECTTGNQTLGWNAGNIGAYLATIENTLVGVGTASNIITASRNTLVGFQSAFKLNSGSQNIIVGSNSAINATTANDNILIGTDIATALTTGSKNTLLGHQAVSNATNPLNNVVIGSNTHSITQTLENSVSIGAYNSVNQSATVHSVQIGANVASIASNVYNSVLIGTHSTSNTTTNLSNAIIIGAYSGLNNTANNVVIIGHNAGATNQGNENTIVGYEAGYQNTTGDGNLILGFKSGHQLTTGDNNTLIGAEAGYNLQTGSRNILVGSAKTTSTLGALAAAGSMVSGDKNIIVGVEAGKSITNASQNIIIGDGAGQSLTTSGQNIIIGTDAAATITNPSGPTIAIGHYAGNTNTYDENIYIGDQAGRNSTGVYNTIIGHEASVAQQGNHNTIVGYHTGGDISRGGSTTGSYNLLVGGYVGYSLTTGARNVLLGTGDNAMDKATGYYLTIGSDNTIIGFRAGGSLTDGNKNVLIGSNAGALLSSGIGNMIFGYNAGNKLVAGSYNILMGENAGTNIVNTSNNICIGYESGYSLNTGFQNTNIGYRAGYNGQSSSYNIHIGDRSGYKSITDRNILIGADSGFNITSGTKNIFIGDNSGVGDGTDITGSYNIFFGSNSGANIIGASKNIFMGADAGSQNENGQKNIYIGHQSGKDAITSSQNIFIGSATSDTAGVGSTNTTGTKNIFIGTDVGIVNTSGSNDIFIGINAGQKNTLGQDNIYIGQGAGREATEGNYNIAIGFETNRDNDTGDYNIIMGYRAGREVGTNISRNIILGAQAGEQVNTDELILIGTQAGQNITTGYNNIAIGTEAGMTNTTANNNILIGSETGKLLTGDATTGFGNTIVIGHLAGRNLTTASDNIIIGTLAGETITTGSKNVIIGTNAQNNGNSSNVVIIGQDAGINNNANNSIFIGHEAGLANDQGENNIYIGAGAGKAVADGYFNIGLGYEVLNEGKAGKYNTVVGTLAATLVNNREVFQGNNIFGTYAALSSNLATTSVLVGFGVNGQGTGGLDNIIIGTSSGNKIGNPNEYYASLLSNVAIGAKELVINVPFGAGSNFFRVGDYINVSNSVAQNNSAPNFIEPYEIVATFGDTNSNLSGNTIIWINTPLTDNYYTTTAQVYVVMSTSRLEYGANDNSKASANLIMGTNAANQMTVGAKNIAIGTAAMNENISGKYNNILGFNAGYSLKTDNNTCIGTFTGYSLDLHANAPYPFNNLVFDKQTNFITDQSSTVDFTNIYTIGTVFTISGSSSNDGRYTIYDILSSNTVQVQGYPEITEDGVTKVISNTNDYQYADSNYNFINASFTSGEFSFEVDTTQLPWTPRLRYDGVSSNLSGFNGARVVKISGSQFNDGVHTISSILYGSPTYFNLTSPIYIEPSGANITMSSYSINSVNGITSGNDMVPVSTITDINVVFGNNRGVYSVEPLSDTYRLLPRPDALFSSATYAYENNNTVLLDTNSGQYLTAGYNKANVVFQRGINRASSGATSSGLTARGYDIMGSMLIYTQINIDEINHKITFNGDTYSGYGFGNDLQNKYVRLLGPFTTNKNKIVKIIDIDTDFFSIPYVTTLTYDSSYSVLLTESTVIPTDTDPAIFEIFYLDIAGSNEYLEPKQIVMIDSVYYGYGQLTTGLANNINRSITTSKGAHIVQNADSTHLTLAKPRQTLIGPDFNIPAYNYRYFINPTAYTLNTTSNVDAILSAPDIHFQKATINTGFTTAVKSGSLPARITATSLGNYTFSNIAAPVMIYVETGDANEGYYMVDSIPYPYDYMELYVNNDFVANTAYLTTNINVSSISSFNRSSNLQIYLSTDTEYRVLGNQYNHDLVFATTSNATSILPWSAWITPNTSVSSDIVHHYSLNDGTISIEANIPVLSGDYQNLAAQGIFKHQDFSYSDTGNNIVTYTAGQLTILFQVEAEADSLLSNVIINDWIKIIGPDNADTLFYVSSVPTKGTVLVPFAGWSVNIPNNLTGGFSWTGSNTNVAFEINEFRTSLTPTVSPSGFEVNLADMFSLIGSDQSRHLKFSINEFNSHINTVGAISFNNFGRCGNTLEFTVPAFPSMGAIPENSIPLNEVCPDEYDIYTQLPFTYANYYKLELGCQTPDHINYNVVNARHLNLTSYTGDLTISASSSPKSISFSNLVARATVAGNTAVALVTQGGEYYNPILEPFREIKKHMRITLNGSVAGTPILNDGLSVTITHVDPSYQWFYYVDAGGSTTDETFNTGTLDSASNNVVINQGIITENIDFKLFNTGGPFSSDRLFMKLSNYNTNLSPMYVDRIQLRQAGTTQLDIANSSNNFLYIPEPVYAGSGGNISLSKSQCCGFNTLVVPVVDLENDLWTNIYFKNVGPLAVADAVFTSNTITSATTNFASYFNGGEYIRISGTSSNDGYYQIDPLVIPNPTATTITVVGSPFTAGVDAGTVIRTNTINTLDTAATNLNVFFGGQSIIVDKTGTNDGTYEIVLDIDTSKGNSLYIDDTTPLATQYPLYCRLTRCILTDETSSYIDTAGQTTLSGSAITTTAVIPDVLDIFRTGQTIEITSPGNSGQKTITDVDIPTATSIIITDPFAVVETGVNATIRKVIYMEIIGQPLISVVNNTTKSFHYDDAEGNNVFIGSFAGLYAGGLTKAIYNTYIGPKVGQTNQGSGNILIGSETIVADNANEGATYYNNKFAVYKTNYLGVPTDPLIGGDFGSGTVGINTINPDSYITGSIGTSTTKLVINGACKAYGFTPFTGLHEIIPIGEDISSLEEGMILETSGVVDIRNIVNTVPTVKLARTAASKQVYGVYAGREVLNGRTVYYCASVGEGCIWVSDIMGEVNNGDLITSSTVMGVGQLQADDIIRSSTVAKCIQYVEWDKISKNSKGYKMQLVACVFYAG